MIRAFSMARLALVAQPPRPPCRQRQPNHASEIFVHFTADGYLVCQYLKASSVNVSPQTEPPYWRVIAVSPSEPINDGR
jgi:hypothetical protein